MNKLVFLATYYGKQHQELKTLEELEELTTELINNIRTEGVSSNTPSEISDVLIMLYQLIYLYDIGKEVEKEAEFKINRQIDRIKNTKY